jgi:hypothetical protein
MFLKGKSYWLKGATIGFISPLVIFFFYTMANFFCPNDLCRISNILIWIPDRLLKLDFISLLVCNGRCKGFDTLVEFLTVWPSFTIIGALIGTLYGALKKFKNK